MNIAPLYLALSLACFADAPKAVAAWPKCFDQHTNDGYCFVTIRENGEAVYLKRITHDDGSVYLLFDPSARWGYFPNPTKLARFPNIWVETKQFRFDYHLEEKKLTEIDKMGVQRILIRRTNSNPTDEAQKPNPEQGGADQPATAPESKPEGKGKPQPESNVAPR